MKPRIAILAALPREITPLVKGWPVRKRIRNESILIAECDRAIAVCAGMGRERVTRALEIAESCGPLRMVLSVGYAGGLHAGMETNALSWPAAVVDAETGQHFACETGSGTLVTTDHVVDHKEKLLLAKLWNADLVDMEAATVAKLAQARGLPFRALRVVSDDFQEVLPDFNRFINARGEFREAAFAGYVVLHPWMIPTAIRIGLHTARASQTMAKALRELLEQAE